MPPVVESVVQLQRGYFWWPLTGDVNDDSLQLLPVGDFAPVQNSAVTALLLTAKDQTALLHRCNLRIRKYVKMVLKKFLSDVFNVWYHSRVKYTRKVGLASGFLVKGSTKQLPVKPNKHYRN